MPRNRNSGIKYGEKTIKMSIHFWTNGIPSREGAKTAEFKGVVHLNANKTRGIKHDAIPFNDKAELFVKMQELLDRQSVRLVTVKSFSDERVV
jgi:hypothetical protein